MECITRKWENHPFVILFLHQFLSSYSFQTIFHFFLPYVTSHSTSFKISEANNGDCRGCGSTNWLTLPSIWTHHQFSPGIIIPPDYFNHSSNLLRIYHLRTYANHSHFAYTKISIMNRYVYSFKIN